MVRGTPPSHESTRRYSTQVEGNAGKSKFAKRGPRATTVFRVEQKAKVRSCLGFRAFVLDQAALGRCSDVTGHTLHFFHAHRGQLALPATSRQNEGGNTRGLGPNGRKEGRGECASSSLLL